ncbi:hypothetical protein BGZ76_004443 [Entomortierella beljakovae]|nr:hypothetical protein BGZ76_004443 [Entomortierella beljakovae]
MTNSTSSSQSSQSAAISQFGQCKAIAVSTKQRCSKSGKLDGYCSEKHRQQGLASSSQSPESDSAIKKTVHTNEQESTSSPTKATKATTTASKKPSATARKPRKATPKKQLVESSDEFRPESDGDFSPESSDSNDSDSDDDSAESEEEDDDVDELTGKLASVKIKPNDPTLPSKDGKTEPLKTKIKRNKSNVFGTGAVLAPPKNKTQSSTASGRPTGGFWIPAPPQATIPESTIQILAAVKEKLGLQEDETAGGPHSAPQKTSSGFFNYRRQIHKYLHQKPDENDNPNSKRAAARQIFGKLFSFVKKGSEPEPPKPYEKPLPQRPEGKTVGSGPQYHRPSVDSLAQDLDNLSVKTDDSEVIPNQCQGYNKDGYRCKRKVKLDRPVTKGEVLMCHDHEINDDDEVVVHIEGKGGVLLQWMDLASWVNPGLPDFVQTKLKRSMEKPISADDKPGYIYVYQLKDSSYTDTHTLFKVGRTDNVTRRMNEWGDKCGKPPTLLEVFPEQGSLAPKDENDLAETATRTAGDNEVTGLRCRYAHRVERLIHIELKPLHDKHHVCSCNTKHMEWFKVPHKEGLSEEQQKQQAWLQIRRVIVHWMSYMEEVYGPG